MDEKFNSASGPCALPEKMNVTRARAGSVGYEQARTSRGQVGTPRNVGVLTDQHGKVIKAAPGVTLEPSPTDPPSFPASEGPMQPDQVRGTNPDDAQNQHCDAPPLEATTEKPEPVPAAACRRFRRTSWRIFRRVRRAAGTPRTTAASRSCPTRKLRSR